MQHREKEKECVCVCVWFLDRERNGVSARRALVVVSIDSSVSDWLH